MQAGIPDHAVVSDDDEFVVRVPGSQTLISGYLVMYEWLIIIEKIEGV